MAYAAIRLGIPLVGSLTPEEVLFTAVLAAITTEGYPGRPLHLSLFFFIPLTCLNLPSCLGDASSSCIAQT